ncbi:MAG: baseplate J/gp47 family protein, partial [Microcystis sp. M04BS1]|nr:baseplate J/gp47 family protein [Microcystis sp. M04BS1]
MTDQFSSYVRLQRRLNVSKHPNLIGLDFLEIEQQEQQWYLRAYFVSPSPDQPNKQHIPPNLTPANFQIKTLQKKIAPLKVESVSYIKNYVQLELNLTTKNEDWLGFHLLTLIDIEYLDSALSQLPFSLWPDNIIPIHPQSPTDLPPPLQLPIEINYLAKDYQSFRQLMLDYLTLLLPQWQERHEADLGIVLVDLLAYVADYLSYYQDAVATESYLGTARRRLSLTRHARLLDYRVSEGCNARVWVQVQATGNTVLPIGTPLLTHNQPSPRRILVNEYKQRIQQANNSEQVFETMETISLYVQHNEMYFYTGGSPQFSLKKGTTKATLKGHFPNLQQGDILIFEEVINPQTGLAEDANYQHRHEVRLSQKPQLSYDKIYSQEITEIEWMLEDKLPFNLVVCGLTNKGSYQQDCTVVRGNIVLADHGCTIDNDKLLDTVLEQGKYRPHFFPNGVLTFRVPFQSKIAKKQSAKKTLEQKPHQATPAILLQELGGLYSFFPPQIIGNSNIWIAKKDLLASNPFNQDFVVEIEEDGLVYLRFGDGKFGKRPSIGHQFQPIYRLGNGIEGNVGKETITTIVSDDFNIIGIRNPMPAQGGEEPESLEEIRLNAPVVFYTQKRCVTEADYAARAETHPDVMQAIAIRQWTGSWNTLFIYVLRHEGRSVDSAFAAEIKEYLTPWAIIGTDLRVEGAQFVPVAITLKVYIKPHTVPNQVLGILNLA